VESDVDVWFDKGGNIIAWGNRGNATDVGQVVPEAGAGLMTTVVRVSGEQRDRLHQTHRIDPETKQLRIRDDAAGS